MLIRPMHTVMFSQNFMNVVESRPRRQRSLNLCPPQLPPQVGMSFRGRWGINHSVSARQEPVGDSLQSPNPWQKKINVEEGTQVAWRD